MKHAGNLKSLPVLTAGLGGIALMLRGLLYTFAVDEKNLLVGHPLGIALWVLVAISFVFIAASVRKLDGSAKYEDNFGPSQASSWGHNVLGIGIIFTVVRKAPLMPGYLGLLWLLFGYGSIPCLLLAANARRKGTQPFFLCHMIPSLFFIIHIINNYHAWSSNPQFQDYVFGLFACIALALFGYHQCAFDVGMGKRRMLLFTGLSAMFLCLTALATLAYAPLYLSGLFWAATSLCRLTPVPKPAEDGA